MSEERKMNLMAQLIEALAEADRLELASVGIRLSEAIDLLSAEVGEAEQAS